ncbi:hypothetical protein RB11222 [Rhodopirellula baltica SH 1]|uniref:Uncharacterized protein n=1 Tax=Rhodopirellula baltica (strain DSM 10527 / NCIMB 13988 / SH1) TaxID=243090 RepID=Q7UEP0_RHOBA|nr:hypothetical protein RB11222 [Rhodopirellula baltica SH 1]
MKFILNDRRNNEPSVDRRLAHTPATNSAIIHVTESDTFETAP